MIIGSTGPMKCPTDDSTLVMSERNGVEIDYCPQCRGVWLDRGELDKIIDRAHTSGTHAPMPAPRESSGQRDGYEQRPYKKKRENWLSELFD